MRTGEGSAVRDLVRAIAFDRAYQLASVELGSVGPACMVCGLPAVRMMGYGSHYPVPLCGTCAHPRPTDAEPYQSDYRCRKAIERLMRIAGDGE